MAIPEVTGSKWFYTHLSHASIYVCIKCFPDFWHSFGLEGSAEANEKGRQKGTVCVVNRPTPHTPSDLRSLAVEGLPSAALVYGTARGRTQQLLAAAKALSISIRSRLLRPKISISNPPFLLNWTTLKSKWQSAIPVDCVHCSDCL